MFQIRMVIAATFVAIVAAGSMMPSVATAQSTTTAESTPKQFEKAQLKAARKANRARKNAELSTLEKNGYQPAADQSDYPKDLQDAEKKAAAAKASSPR